MSTEQLSALLVDDEPSFRRVLRTSLVASGFAIEEAPSGEEAIAILAQRPFDLMLLDMNMPGVGGVETCREVRSLLPKIGIVMVTVRDAENDMVRALEAGADDYLTKPFSFVVLLARLRALARRNLPARPTILAAGDVTLDPATHEVELAGTPVSLTPREYALLDYFLRHPGRVVAKIELLDNVWDATENTDPNAVEVYVGYLRRKLGRSVLRTVRGAGYRLGG